ncbi:MAG: helix-turn-helix domain-containing protein [Actinomycetota bacterium]|nr:helix-turn-helix domain-containing protein [Actinomycetota bacterium]MDQ6946014.1 helix-turn-helix domain-containing protein [Actinomycetota bacterium]
MGDSVSDVGVLNKAVAILDAVGAAPMTLADLSAATGLPRATLHRLAVALERHRLVARDRDGRFELGPRVRELARSGSVNRRALADGARPALVMLRDATGESAQLYVPAGDARICVAALESPHSLRTIVPVGASLPMDRGSAGRVLYGESFGDSAPGGLAWAESVEEREPGVASVSAPVIVAGEVIAAVSVSGPIERTTRHPGRKYAAAVMEAAAAIGRAMS